MATFADKPTLTGERVVLRPIVAEHAEAMWRDLHDEEALRLTGTQATFDGVAIEQWAATRANTPDRLDLAVVDPATGAWVGEAVINEGDLDNRSCNFRIALTPSARNRGIGTEATRLIVDYVFEEIEPPMHRISLGVYAFNPRAIAVYERIGFVREGVARDALFWDGEFVDEILMAMLRSDHEALRG
ncbi:MAG: GNAT family protein [Acidimicrobiia bacterium]